MPVSAPQRPASSGTDRRRTHLTATTTTDATLVTLAARGDERAFELLFQRHRSDVQAYAVRMLRDHGRAEDVVQDVFVSAMRAIRGATPETQPVHVRAWLREIARKACIDQWRGSTRRGEVSLDAPEGLMAGDALRLADEDSLTRATDDRQAVATLRLAFGDLPELQHAVLVQRELEGRSIPEIAARLELTPTVVEGQLARGRRALGQAYRELDSGERCIAVRALCDVSTGGRLGVRDRHRVGRHVQGCDGCRRYAHESGVDARLVDRSLLSRASLLLPLPLLRRLPFEHAIAGEAAGGLIGAKVLVGAAVIAASGGGVYVAKVAPPSSPAPVESSAGPRAESPFGPVVGPDGRTVVRVAGGGGFAPSVVLPSGRTLGGVPAASPFLPPWLAATPAAAAGMSAADEEVRIPAERPETTVSSRPGETLPSVSPAPATGSGAGTPSRGTAPGTATTAPPAGRDAAPASSAPTPLTPAVPAGTGQAAPATTGSGSPSAGDAPGTTPDDDGPTADAPSPDAPASVETPVVVPDTPATEPVAEAPAEEPSAPVEAAPAEPAPVEQAPVEEAPVEAAPAESAPAPVEPDPVPAAEAPDGGAPVAG